MTAISVPAVEPAPPLSSRGEAEELMTRLNEVMDALIVLVEEETKLVRAGRLKEAAKFERRKAELARSYFSDTARLKASARLMSEVMPGVASILRHRHEIFQAMLQMNLTVLATAHAVSEGILRGVSDQLARKASPQTYAASGRQVPPAPRNAQPLTVSRVL